MSFSPLLMRSVSSAIACGWSPEGVYSEITSKGFSLRTICVSTPDIYLIVAEATCSSYWLRSWLYARGSEEPLCLCLRLYLRLYRAAGLIRQPGVGGVSPGPNASTEADFICQQTLHANGFYMAPGFTPHRILHANGFYTPTGAGEPQKKDKIII